MCAIYPCNLIDHSYFINTFYRLLLKRLSNVSKDINVARTEVHKEEKKLIKSFANNVSMKQINYACDNNRIDEIIPLVKRGADVNLESSRGITPLLCFIINSAAPSQIQELVALKVNLNGFNQYGVTALKLCVRMKDVRTIHVLMKSLASEIASGGAQGHGRSALHWCAIHNSEVEARVLNDYVKEGGDDPLR